MGRDEESESSTSNEVMNIYSIVTLLYRVLEKDRPACLTYLANRANNDLETFLSRCFPAVLAYPNTHGLLESTCGLIDILLLLYKEILEDCRVLRSLLLQEHLKIRKIVMLALEMCQEDSSMVHRCVRIVYFTCVYIGEGDRVDVDAKAVEGWAREGCNVELLRGLQEQYRSEQMMSWLLRQLLPLFTRVAGGAAGAGEGNV